MQLLESQSLGESLSLLQGRLCLASQALHCTTQGHCVIFAQQELQLQEFCSLYDSGQGWSQEKFVRDRSSSHQTLSALQGNTHCGSLCVLSPISWLTSWAWAAGSHCTLPNSLGLGAARHRQGVQFVPVVSIFFLGLSVCSCFLPFYIILSQHLQPWSPTITFLPPQAKSYQLPIDSLSAFTMTSDLIS